MLNRGFEDRFREEAAALAAPPVTLEFPGRQGRAARRKALVPEHRLSEILSEGEQRVIALADFLAEASLRTSVAPLVFDDPVNSLDYKRLKHVVARLVALSAQQQVVVFTHNVMFAFELLGRFEKSPDDCSYFDVGRSETGTGLITGGTHPWTDTVKHLRGEINSLLQDAGTLTGEAQAALIERGYDKMRSWCEVVVEDELLQGVTKRLQPNVQMTKLPQIRGDRLTAAIEPIMETFDKACRVMGGHSQPLETLAVRPTLDEAHKDWEEAQERGRRTSNRKYHPGDVLQPTILHLAHLGGLRMPKAPMEGARPSRSRCGRRTLCGGGVDAGAGMSWVVVMMLAFLSCPVHCAQGSGHRR